MSKDSNGNGNGKMTLTRRDFLKVSAAAGAGGGLLSLANMQNAGAVNPTGSVAVNRYVPTTCPFCSVGCGQITEVAADGTVLEVRGDPNHVTNRGALCPKGASSVQFINGDRRIGTDENKQNIKGPVYRDGNASGWTAYAQTGIDGGWARAIDDVATRLLTARSAYQNWSATGYIAGQNCKSLAFLGCSHATNEENWVYRKMIANLGTNNTEHQARI